MTVQHKPSLLEGVYDYHDTLPVTEEEENEIKAEVLLLLRVDPVFLQALTEQLRNLELTLDQQSLSIESIEAVQLEVAQMKSRIQSVSDPWRAFRDVCLSAASILDSQNSNKKALIRRDLKRTKESAKNLLEELEKLSKIGRVSAETYFLMAEVEARITAQEIASQSLPDGTQPKTHRYSIASGIKKIMIDCGLNPKKIEDLEGHKWDGDSTWAKLTRLGIILTEGGNDPLEVGRYLT